MIFKCEHCEDDIEGITVSDGAGLSKVFLSHKEEANLYVCTSRDCSNRGVVIAIGTEIKEDG